ncbi:MAG: GTPase ObgE [Planctomycetia bacterium 21-64-5]|nr:MAG: GTPase ObgE [Planctomycetia bacterium 21-64-5]HQU41974.1 GTPase ObgE [Pirellulales bacterium]
MFVDRVKIHVQGGKGGNGCLSFRREKYVPRGGPDGGDGGDGGSVILIAEPGVDSLAALSHRRHWKAASGEPGRGANCHGRSAEDLVIRVPLGTIVYDAIGGFVFKDLAQPGDRVVAARGGSGGKGNTHFKSATNRAPRESTPGDAGEARDLVLELKVIADVGLIGKPNAGKSTLLSRLSRARPEIADYPFTTKYPNLGLVQLSFDRSFVLADIPGLIEGAHAGLGLGHEFLRHIERAGILVHLVEPEPADGSDPVTNYRVIREELRLYNPALVERPEIVVVSKAELPSAADVKQRLADALGRDVPAISAVTGQGVDKLLHGIARELDELAETKLAEAKRLRDAERDSAIGTQTAAGRPHD